MIQTDEIAKGQSDEQSYGFLKFLWSSVLVALGYIGGIFVAGMIGPVFGIQISARAAHNSSLIPLLIGTLLLGAFIRPYASRLTLSHGQGFLLWGSLILFNFGSVTLEGAYFASTLVSIPVPMLVMQQLFATIATLLAQTLQPDERIHSWPVP